MHLEGAGQLMAYTAKRVGCSVVIPLVGESMVLPKMLVAAIALRVALGVGAHWRWRRLGGCDTSLALSKQSGHTQDGRYISGPPLVGVHIGVVSWLIVGAAQSTVRSS